MKRFKDVDCEWMQKESHKCKHPKRYKGWRKFFNLTCTEEVIEGVTCDYKESLWDMLQRDPNATPPVKKQSGTRPIGRPPGPGYRPAPPPAPPRKPGNE